MKPTYLTLFGAFALAATGCAGDFSSGGKDVSDNSGADAGVTEEADAAPPTSELSSAQALFEANVRPIVSVTCNPDGACHGSQDPAFISAQPTEAYATINIHRDRLYPGYESAGSALIANGNGGHYLATFSDNDLSAIQGWLAQEAIEADSGGGVTASAMAVWSGCMKLEQWDELNVASLWADKDADNQGDCDACHNLGADGFIASNQSQRVFDVITQSPALMPSYFTLSASGQEVVVNRARLETVGNQLPPHDAHGAFQVDGNAMDALTEFHRLTKLNVDGLGLPCDPPRF